MSLTAEDIQLCYQILLGRDPESDKVIQEKLGIANRDSLVALLMASAEFQNRYESVLPRLADRELSLVPLSAPAIEIESEVSAEDFDDLRCRIRDSWVEMGLREPHFSVLTDPKFLHDRIDDSLAEFWNTGEPDVEELVSLAKRHGLTDERAKTCVEYGCGVGRLSVPLSRRFEQVHAYDISLNHLRLAKARAEQQGIQNLKFHDCGEDVLVNLEPCDFYISVIVLQHNQPPIIRSLIDRALASLRPNGLAVFQVPTYIRDYQFKARDYLDQGGGKGMEMHCLPQKVILDVACKQRCDLLEVREDKYTGSRDRMVSNTFVFRKRRRRFLPF